MKDLKVVDCKVPERDEGESEEEAEGSTKGVGQTARVATYVAGRTKGRAMFVCLALSELHPLSP